MGRREGGGRVKKGERGGRERTKEEIDGVGVSARPSTTEWEGRRGEKKGAQDLGGVPVCRLRQASTWAQEPALSILKIAQPFPPAGLAAGTEAHLPFYGKKNPDSRRGSWARVCGSGGRPALGVEGGIAGGSDGGFPGGLNSPSENSDRVVFTPRGSSQRQLGYPTSVASWKKLSLREQKDFGSPSWES